MNSTMQDILEETQRLLREEALWDITNERLANREIHIAFLDYTDREFHSENVLRLTKIQWLAAGMPFSPIPIQKV